ncbi:MAG: molybdate ABC transporter substrate-binding protein [Tepidiformaceae bacterium]
MSDARGIPGSFMFAAAVILGGLMLGVWSACGGSDAKPTPSPTTPGTSANSPATASATATADANVKGDITVFAASSLTDAFTAAGKSFETAHPGTKVTFSFGASSALATQINEGAPADVFASADGTNMQVVTDKGGVTSSTMFASNTPVVVVPKGNATVTSFADLQKPGIKIVLAAKHVPIGKYARQILTNASGAGGIAPDFSTKVLANLKSEEANVRAVLSKVQLGEADAGIVYQTDIAAGAGDVTKIDIPGGYNVVAKYPVATVKSSKNAPTAHAFVDYILSDPGQAILAKYGFGKPGS